MNISVEDAHPSHLAGIHELVREWGYAARERETLDSLNALLDSSNHQVYVAVSNSSVVGWVVAEKRLSLGEALTCEITGLVVSAQCRRAGIGKLLVSAVEEWSQSQGLSRLVVRSNVRRLESHEFYPSVGFERTKTTHVYAKDLKGSGPPR